LVFRGSTDWREESQICGVILGDHNVITRALL
jgi:hypothetical protein